jgi:hypothetical protein
MDHLRPLAHQSATMIHAVKDKEFAWCGWRYVTDQTLNGTRIPRAASSPGPLTCKKCAGAMRQAIHETFPRLTPGQAEQVYELAAKLSGVSTRSKPPRSGPTRRSS